MRCGREGSGPASAIAVSASRPFAEEVRAMSVTVQQFNFVGRAGRIKDVRDLAELVSLAMGEADAE